MVDSTTATAAPGRAPAAALLAGGALALLIGLPSLELPFGLDQGQQATLGRMMAEGKVLYRDVWDSRSPGIYVLSALAWKLGLRQMWGLRAFDLAWQVATAVLLGALAQRLWRGRWIGALAAALYSLAYYGLGDFWHTCEPDGKLALPTLLALGLLRAPGSALAPMRVFAAGLIWGFAFLIKYPAFALAVPLAASLWTRDRPLLARRLTLLGAGAALPALAWIAWSAADGSLAALYWDTVHFNAGYRALGPQVNTIAWRARELASLVLANREVVAPLLLLPIAGHCARSLSLPAAWLTAALGMLLAQDKYNAMHYYPTLAPLALLSAAALAGCASGVARLWTEHRAQALTWGLALALAGAAGHRTVFAWTRFAHAALRAAQSDEERERLWRAHQVAPFFDFGDELDVARYLIAHRAPEERLLVWGFAHNLYCLSGAPMATRFASHPPLISPFAWPGYRAQFYEDLAKTPPSWIAVLHGDVVPEFYGHTLDSAAAAALHPPLMALLERSESVLSTHTVELFRVRGAATSHQEERREPESLQP